jgi:hypothetical protein
VLAQLAQVLLVEAVQTHYLADIQLLPLVVVVVVLMAQMAYQAVLAVVLVHLALALKLAAQAHLDRAMRVAVLMEVVLVEAVAVLVA